MFVEWAKIHIDLSLQLDQISNRIALLFPKWERVEFHFFFFIINFTFHQSPLVHVPCVIGTLDEYGISLAVRTISRCLSTGDVFWKPTVCLLNKLPAPTHFSCLYSQWRLLQKYVCLDGIVRTIYQLGEGTRMHF